MSYTAQILSCFRTYATLLENGIPSVLDLFQVSGNPAFKIIPNDKSVHVSADLGTKVIQCITHEEELRNAFSQMEETLLAIDSRYVVILTGYYCHQLTKDEAQIASGLAHREAFSYAQAVFALHHPKIDFDEQDFSEFCSEAQIGAIPETIDEVKQSYQSFKEHLLANPGSFTAAANKLPEIRAGVDNSFFLETTQKDRQFFRDRNTLTVALFYENNAVLHFSVIVDIIRSEQGSKQYLAGVDRLLHEVV